MLKRDITTQTSTTDEDTYDIMIVGAGVAGVAVAEKLSRPNGKKNEKKKKVLLVEKAPKIGTEASGEQHCWGQFGSLYLNLEDPKVAQACLDNVELLLTNYPLPGNNLAAVNGKLVSQDPQELDHWYRDDPLFYYYADPDEPSFDKVYKETIMKEKGWDKIDSASAENKWLEFKDSWRKRICRALARAEIVANHQWGKDTTHGLLKGDEGEIKRGEVLLKQIRKDNAKNNEFDKINIRTPVKIQSTTDRPMRSKRILTSLFNRFRLQGGEVAFNTEIVDYDLRKDGRVNVFTATGQRYIANTVIFTAGKGLNEIKNSNVNTVISPLLIVTPAICDRHVVSLTPSTKFTINHLHHYDPKAKQTYSIIGNGDAISPTDSAGFVNEEGKKVSAKNIIKQAKEIFPELRKMPDEALENMVYFGSKTEFMENDKRNYHYAFVPLDEPEVEKKSSKEEESKTENTKMEHHVFAAVPGKFTLAYSLSEYIFEKLEGTKSPAYEATAEEEAAYKSLTHTHLNMMSDEESQGSEFEDETMEAVIHSFDVTKPVSRVNSTSVIPETPKEQQKQKQIEPNANAPSPQFLFSAKRSQSAIHLTPETRVLKQVNSESSTDSALSDLSTQTHFSSSTNKTYETISSGKESTGSVVIDPKHQQMVSNQKKLKKKWKKKMSKKEISALLDIKAESEEQKTEKEVGVVKEMKQEEKKEQKQPVVLKETKQEVEMQKADADAEKDRNLARMDKNSNSNTSVTGIFAQSSSLRFGVEQPDPEQKPGKSNDSKFKGEPKKKVFRRWRS